jgi:hypothetical protein
MLLQPIAVGLKASISRAPGDLGTSSGAVKRAGKSFMNQ